MIPGYCKARTVFTQVCCGQLGAAREVCCGRGDRTNGFKEQLSLWTGCTECIRVLRVVHVHLSVSVEHKKRLFHSKCTTGQTCPYPALHLARVKSAVEISSHHAQPNKAQSCDWEVSHTALRVITVSVINSMFFSVAVCLSAICWALRHKVGWLPEAGRH